MIRSYSFQNSRAFLMACATFETTAQKTLGTLACSAIYDSFSWNASLRQDETLIQSDTKELNTHLPTSHFRSTLSRHQRYLECTTE